MVEQPPLTGKRLRAAVVVAARRLEANREAVNSLNVFPVPDGDTGTNMCLTMAAAVREMEKVSSPSLGEMAKALSLGSLMGARGNSGVILSQLFRGLGKYLQEYRTATPLQVAWSFQEGVETAYKAVMKPVEGTILTVAREMSRAALQTGKKGSSLEEVLESAIIRGREVLARTPDMLPVLKQAGVVDAGGMGLLLLMEGVLHGVRGEEDLAASGPSTGAQGPVASVAPVVLRAEAPAAAGPLGAAAPAEEIRFAYDTQLLIRGQRLAVDRIRAQLDALGDSLLVVGDPHLVKVHVHTNEPHRALATCLLHGEIVEASVENMREQHEQVKQSRLAAVSPGEASRRAAAPSPQMAEVGQAAGLPGLAAVPAMVLSLPGTRPAPSADELGVVVVASGEGLTEVLRSLGADVVVSGGQTMNPSTEDLLKAVETLPSREVLILPNNGNILMAAKQVAELTKKAVRVVPSKSIPQGIAALVALNRNEDLAKNQARMEQALGRVKTGEITRAVRDSRYKDIEIHEGDYIGLLDDEIVTTGSDVMDVLTDLAGRMVGEETEIVTVFSGQPVGDAEAEIAAARIRECCPDHEVEMHHGGQPLYHYLLSVE